jgi:hypothetical protein
MAEARVTDITFTVWHVGARVTQEGGRVRFTVEPREIPLLIDDLDATLRQLRGIQAGLEAQETESGGSTA